MTIKDFGRILCPDETPVVDCGAGDHGEGGIRGPFPEYHSFGHFVRLELLLGVEVEDLDAGTGTECNDVLGRGHDGRFCRDGSAGDLAAVFEVHHCHL